MAMLATVDQMFMRMVEEKPEDPYLLAVAAYLLDQASEMALEIIERPTWDADQVPASVAQTVIAAAARAYRNPSNTIQTQEGPFGSRINGSDVDLFFTEKEVARLKQFEAPEPTSSASFGVLALRTGGRVVDRYGYSNPAGSGTLHPDFPRGWVQL